MSSGAGYTLQILGQKELNPAIASLIMCLESVFSALGGWLLLGQNLSMRESAGCALIFAAVVLSQLPLRSCADAKERVMLRAAGGIPYELTRGRVKRLNLHVRRDGTVALSIPLRTTLEAADAYVIAEAEWIRAAQARQAAREKRQEELPDKAAALAHFTAMSDKVYPAFAGVLGGRSPPSKCAA